MTTEISPTTTRTTASDLARFLSGALLAEPMREYVTNLGCTVLAHVRINSDGERVEHVTVECER